MRCYNLVEHMASIAISARLCSVLLQLYFIRFIFEVLSVSLCVDVNVDVDAIVEQKKTRRQPPQ